MNDSRAMRKVFLAALVEGLRFTWPILSLLIGATALLGITIGLIEGWSIAESLYFAYVTGLTIGYGDLVPKSTPGRLLAVLIGLCGIMLTAMLGAVAVKALASTTEKR